MHTSTTIHTLLARRLAPATCLLLVAAALPSLAYAGGEPKNELPFTRHVGNRAVQIVSNPAQTVTSGHGEPKNELPFTRRISAYPDRITGGEQKNEVPFTATVEPAPPASDSWFGWIDGVLVGVVVISLVIAGTGVRHLTRREVPRTA